jgi:ribosomal-protein-alanine N-acetyltransferase
VTLPVATKRLLLRELELNDAAAIAARAGDRRVTRHLVQIPTPYPVTVARGWVMRRIEWWRAGRGVTLAIARRDHPGELLGTISLRAFPRDRTSHRLLRCGAPGVRRAFDRRAELGYWLAANEWGRGLVTEAGFAVIALGFTELALTRIYAQVLGGNHASCRVLDKLGFVLEGVKRQHMRKVRQLHDVLLYGLLREEWANRI